MLILLVLSLATFLGVTSALPQKQPTPIPECGPNEMLTDCVDNCQITCKNRITGYKEYCIEDCSQPTCVCLPAHFRHDNGTCVYEKDCSPPQCGEGEVYDSCGTSRMETCEERGNTCQSQPLHCVEGCFCPQGFFLDTNNTCIPEDKCPSRTCEGENEYFDACPRKAVQSCAEIGLDLLDTDCCQPECRCIEGYYRDVLGNCIFKDQCYVDAVIYASAWLQDFNSEEEKRKLNYELQSVEPRNDQNN